MVCIAHDSNYPFTVGVKLMDSAGFSQESFSGRSVPRVQVVMSCRLSWPGVEVVALTRDFSPTGLALSLSGFRGYRCLNCGAIDDTIIRTTRLASQSLTIPSFPRGRSDT